MFKNTAIGQYYPAESPVHSMDPRMKLILTTAYIVAVFLATSALGYAIMLFFVAFCVHVAKIPAKVMLRTLGPLRMILIFTFILNLFFTQTGESIFKLWFLNITNDGLKLAVQMGIRLVLLVTGTSLMMLTTSPIDLTDGMESLMSPLKKIKFPAHELAMMMTIALRFIPTLIEETDKIMKAQMARGADFETGGLIGRAKKLVPLLVPLFVSAFRRAEELAMAMESRCYHGGEGRTRLKELKFSKVDLAAAIVVALFLAAIIIFGRA